MNDIDIGQLACKMTRRANSGTWDGRAPNGYMFSCRWILPQLGVCALFTRDIGGHSGGWWKNPDYERCWHLSLSFFDAETCELKPKDSNLTGVFIDSLFGEAKRWLWAEPPYSAEGKRRDIWHYRLFADQHWQPIKPRGEVYSREFTEAGWKSFSEVTALWEMERQRELERIADVVSRV